MTPVIFPTSPFSNSLQYLSLSTLLSKSLTLEQRKLFHTRYQIIGASLVAPSNSLKASLFAGPSELHQSYSLGPPLPNKVIDQSLQDCFILWDVKEPASWSPKVPPVFPVIPVLNILCNNFKYCSIPASSHIVRTWQ